MESRDLLSFTERARASPVVATVGAVLLIIVGILIVVYPGLLVWIVGIGLVLMGVGVLVAVYLPNDRRSL